MKELNVYKPEGWITHVAGIYGAGKTTLIGDMLYHEMNHGPCAYLFTRREGNMKSGSWTVLPPEVIKSEKCRVLLLEDIKDLDKLITEWRTHPLQALGIDTSTGLELLIKAKITGSETKELVTRGGQFQHKQFKNELCKYIQDLRDVSRFSMLVSTAIPSAYNPESGNSDTGASGTSIDAEKRMSPDGENQDAKVRILSLSDYAFHIEQEEGKGTGRIMQRTLKCQPSLKLMTKNRLPLGVNMKDIVLEPKVGANWPKLKEAIMKAWEGGAHED